MFRGLKNLVARSGWFGRFSGFFSSLSILSGSNRNWSEDAGPRYDNSAVSAAINYLFRQMTDKPALVVQRERVTEKGKIEWVAVNGHGLPRAMSRGQMAYEQLIHGAALSLVCFGNGYWVKDRTPSGGVKEFIFLAPWRVVAVTDRDSPFGDRKADGTWMVTFYEFTNPDGVKVPIKVADMVHLRWGIDPAKPCYGMSPIAAALREVVTDNEAATLGAALLRNAGIPGVAIVPKGDGAPNLTPDQRQDLNTKFQRRVSGDMAGTPFLAPFPADFVTVGFSPDKLVLAETRALAVSRILSGIGIDPMVLGLPSEQKTYSNFGEAMRHAWRQGVKPCLGIISAALDRQCLRVDFESDGLRVSWDLSEVPEEQEDIDKEADRLRKLWMSGAIRRSEIRTALGYDADAGDDVFYLDLKLGAAPKDPEAVKKALKAAAMRQLPALEALDALNA